uniref:Uncharacterized protein n=1 Tax=Leersia perrieri TaxID=77586 RepID=A0A0D9VF25_9ORYZ
MTDSPLLYTASNPEAEAAGAEDTEDSSECEEIATESNHKHSKKKAIDLPHAGAAATDTRVPVAPTAAGERAPADPAAAGGRAPRSRTPAGSRAPPGGASAAAVSGTRLSRRPGEQVHVETRRRLQFGTPEGALQAAEALLRHPPVTPAQGSNTQRWFDDLVILVDTAQQGARGG